MQTYANHAHRPVLFTVGFFLWVLAVVGWAAAAAGQPWGRIAGVIGLLGATGVALFIGRVYIVRLQDRIILLEMRIRATEVLSHEECIQLAALPKAKTVALRFASDGELSDLLARIVEEDLTPDAIKRAITGWRADYLRT